jgi:hypothetical protein
MLYREIIIVGFDIHAKHINTLWANLRMFKLVVHTATMALKTLKTTRGSQQQCTTF